MILRSTENENINLSAPQRHEAHTLSAPCLHVTTRHNKARTCEFFSSTASAESHYKYLVVATLPLMSYASKASQNYDINPRNLGSRQNVKEGQHRRFKHTGTGRELAMLASFGTTQRCLYCRVSVYRRISATRPNSPHAHSPTERPRSVPHFRSKTRT